jgi:hypothetical protein
MHYLGTKNWIDFFSEILSDFTQAKFSLIYKFIHLTLGY